MVSFLPAPRIQNPEPNSQFKILFILFIHVQFLISANGASLDFLMVSSF